MRRSCDRCGADFEMLRHNARFCGKRCLNEWYRDAHRPRRQARASQAAEKRNRGIGSCSLCGTQQGEILEPRLLGMRTHNGSAKFHRDHILPKSKGGGDDAGNRRWLCWVCNSLRMDMDQKHDAAVGAAGLAFWRTINPAPSPSAGRDDRGH
jgi:hypothetical protein